MAVESKRAWIAQISLFNGRYWTPEKSIRCHGGHAGVAAMRAIKIYKQDLRKGTRIKQLFLRLRVI